MIGILVTSHGNFCAEVIRSMEMIAGETDVCESLKLDENGVLDYSKRLYETLGKMLKKYSGVIIFSDLYGGTPYNECANYILKNNANVKLIGGMNMPMIMETCMSLNSSDQLDKLADAAIQIGRNTIQKFECPNDEDALDIT